MLLNLLIAQVLVLILLIIKLLIFKKLPIAAVLLTNFCTIIPKCQSQFKILYIHSSQLSLEMGTVIIPVFTDEEIPAHGESQFL